MAQYARVGTLYELGLVSLGEELIKDALAAARYMYAPSVLGTLPNDDPKQNTRLTQGEVQQSYLFVQGSGLDTAIRTFGLSYRPDTLRETFQAWTIRWSQSSSAIIADGR